MWLAAWTQTILLCHYCFSCQISEHHVIRVKLWRKIKMKIMSWQQKARVCTSPHVCPLSWIHFENLCWGRMLRFTLYCRINKLNENFYERKLTALVMWGSLHGNKYSSWEWGTSAWVIEQASSTKYISTIAASFKTVWLVNHWGIMREQDVSECLPHSPLILAFVCLCSASSSVICNHRQSPFFC